jgi:hypothetical protein
LRERPEDEDEEDPLSLRFGAARETEADEEAEAD